MKVAAALSAIAALAFAPMALGQSCNNAANLATLNQLTITQKIRSRVRGGGQLKQTITVRNTASTAATGVAIRGAVPGDYTFVKASSKPKATHTLGTTPLPVTVSGTVVTIPAGKMLKGTIVYKAVNCPTLTQPQSFAAHVFVPADTSMNCFKGAATSPVTLQKKKTCP